jgi:phage gpG-like protein
MSSRVIFRGRAAWVRMKDRILMELQHPESKTTKTIADKALTGITSRTQKGIDVAGVAFKPYNEKYAKRKKSKKVNLTSSGKMLSRAGFEFEVINQDGRIFIRIYAEGEPKYTIASVHNFGMRSGRGYGFQMPQREFFGLDQKIIDEIMAFTRERWAQIFRQAGNF